MKRFFFYFVMAVIISSCELFEVNYTVTFDSNGGSKVESQTIKKGGKVAKPANPVRANHDFVDWVKTYNGTESWNFYTETVIGDMTLYARWVYQLKLDFSNEKIREDISSYLRNSFQNWSYQASEAELKDVEEYYRGFLINSGIQDYLLDKLSKNNELALRIFEGLYPTYSTDEHASICRSILKIIDNYEVSIYFYYKRLEINITCDYPLKVENVYNKVLEKYSNANSSTIPTDLNNTLQTALLEEVKSGLPLGPIYGRCQLNITFNTMTGEVLYADFYNGGYGEMEKWSTSPTSILISGSGRPYDNLWTDLWNAVRNDLNVTYTSQNMELQNWNVLYLDLHLSGYNPFKYKLVVYILVGSSWWIKPQWGRSFPVGFDTQYHIWTQTGGYDNTATKAAAMILPIDSDVNIDNYAAAKAVAVNYKEINR